MADRDRGITSESLTEAIRHRHAHGSRMWQMIGVLAELERSLTSERTRAGAKTAKGRGVKFGCKPKLTPQQITHARKLIDDGQRREDVAAPPNVDRTILYRALGSVDRRGREAGRLALRRVLHRQYPKQEHAGGLCASCRRFSALV